MDTKRSNAPDLFTPEFKRLKAKNPPPDFSEVLDLREFQSSSHSSQPAESPIRPYQITGTDLKRVEGLKPYEEWRAYEFPRYPGLIVIQNPFLDGYQRYWVCRCLQDFPSQTDTVTNLSALEIAGSAQLWSDFVLRQSPNLSKQDPLRKLRWTTLGYHYDWTAKEYSEDARAEFPSDVNCLSQYLAACLGFGPYRAEAAIVNYYHLDSTLAGHTDHSELDQTAPLFSISFGQTAIFLLGGSTKAVKPMSIYLHSGDICVMSGSCRLAYHAVPRILAPPDSEPVPKCFSLEPQRQQELVFDCSISSALDTDSFILHENSSVDVCDSTGDGQSIPSKITTAVPQENVGDSSAQQNFGGKEISSCALQVNDESSMSKKIHLTEKAVTTEIFPQQSIICVDVSRDNSEMHMHSAKPVVSHQTESCSSDERNTQASNVHSGHCTICDLKKTENLNFQTDYGNNVEKVNCNIKKVIASLDFTPFERYLASARINMNVRQVLPWGVSRLPTSHQPVVSKDNKIMTSGSYHSDDHYSGDKDSCNAEEYREANNQNTSVLLGEERSFDSQTRVKKKKFDM